MMRNRRNGSTAGGDVVRNRMRAWYRKAPGSLLLASEREEVDRLLPYVFGYHIVQIGSLGRDRDLLKSCRIRHRLIIDADYGNGVGDTGLFARAESLPIASDSVDAVVLTHTLELERDPHQVLREAERILIPEGHVLVIGFNPWSLWGLWRLFFKRRHRVPWCLRFVSPTRVKDWLSLLGFDVTHEAPLFFRPPLPYEGLLRRLHFMERAGRRLWPVFGGGYVILARKRISTLTPIRLRWKRRKALVPGLIEPTTRSPHSFMNRDDIDLAAVQGTTAVLHRVPGLRDENHGIRPARLRAASRGRRARGRFRG